MTKVNCDRCGVSILFDTHKKNRGFCAPCAQRPANEELRAKLGDPIPIFLVRTAVVFPSPHSVGSDEVMKVHCKIAAENDSIACRDASSIIRRHFEKLCPGLATSASVTSTALERLGAGARTTLFADLSGGSYEIDHQAEAGDSREVAIAQLDFSKIEEVLVASGVESLNRFAAETSERSFDSFAFDCNAIYGDVLLCLNSNEHLIKTARQYCQRESDFEKNVEMLRLSIGDWKHQGFSDYYDEWVGHWRPIQKSIAAYFEGLPESHDPANEIEVLMVTFCKAFLRLCESIPIKALAPDGLRIAIVLDHDEALFQAERRLAYLRSGGNA